MQRAIDLLPCLSEMASQHRQKLSEEKAILTEELILPFCPPELEV